MDREIRQVAARVPVLDVERPFGGLEEGASDPAHESRSQLSEWTKLGGDGFGRATSRMMPRR